MDNTERCNGCQQDVDLEVCWCGDYVLTHGSYDHSPVPIGCICYALYGDENGYR